MIQPRIREALRRQGHKASDLTDAERERAEHVHERGLAGKAAVEYIMSPEPSPEPEPAAASSNGTGRDPEAADLIDRVYEFSGIGRGSNIYRKDARRFLDEFTVDLGDPTHVTIQHDGRNAVISRDDLVGFAQGRLSRPNRKPVAVALESVNGGAVHWDRALAAMVALLFAAEAS